MKAIPSWKIALSYIFDVPLKKLSSDKNGRMELFLSRGTYKLTTDNAVYSFGMHYRSFARAFEKLSIYGSKDIHRVLVLGWGIGSIGDLLDGHSSVTYIKGVEYDKALIDLYRSLADESGTISIEVVQDDAIDYVLSGGKTEEGSFDLVCSDLFIDNLTPADVVSSEYFDGLLRLCRENGRVMLSKLNMSVKDRHQNAGMEELLSTMGIVYDVVNTYGNRMYTWLKSAQKS